MEAQKSFLDPRTKLLLVFIESVIVLATAGGQRMAVFKVIFTVLPFLLLITIKKYKACIIAGGILFISFGLEYFVFPDASGTLAVMLMLIITIVTRFLPAYLTGVFVIGTTKVSEFKAAMEKMHIPDEITIPMCVMFRFFPTVKEENESIRAAMKMRGIGFGGKKASKVLEYRIVPMITCSAKIGEELSASALTRGLGKSRERTNICKIGFGIYDYMILILAVIAMIYLMLGVMH